MESFVFIIPMIYGAIRIPRIVIIIAKVIPSMTDWAKYREAFLSNPSPIELEIKEVDPILIPTPIAIIIKYTGKVCAIFYLQNKYQLNYKEFEI